MATFFGTLDTTGQTTTFFEDATVAVSRYEVIETGTLETLTMAITASNSGMDWRMVVYEDVAGSRGDLLAQTGLVGSVDAGTYAEAVLTPLGMTSGDFCWAGFQSYGQNLFLRYANNTAGFAGRNLADGTSTPPSPFGSADYTVAPPAAGLPILGEGTVGGGGGGSEDGFVRVGGVWVATDRKARAGGAWV